MGDKWKGSLEKRRERQNQYWDWGPLQLSRWKGRVSRRTLLRFRKHSPTSCPLFKAELLEKLSKQAISVSFSLIPSSIHLHLVLCTKIYWNCSCQSFQQFLLCQIQWSIFRPHLTSYRSSIWQSCPTLCSGNILPPSFCHATAPQFLTYYLSSILLLNPILKCWCSFSELCFGISSVLYPISIKDTIYSYIIK